MSTPFSNIDEFREKHIRYLTSLLGSPIWITGASSLSMFRGTRGVRIHTVEALLEGALPRGTGDPESFKLTDPIHPGRCGHESETALLMLTSGSTGNAKVVPISHRQVMAAISGKAAVRRLPPGRPFLNWVALDHVASLIEIHLQALWLGVDQVHVHAADVVSRPATFLDLVSRHRVCRSFAPNFFLAKLINATPSDGNWDLSSLTVLASGGEPNDTETCISASALLRSYGAPPNVIMPGFGMTETCAGAVFNLDCPAYDSGMGSDVASVGKCMPGIQMRVRAVGEAGGLANPDELGDLEVRGEVVFGGYYGNPEATAQVFDSKGWFRTGDQAFIDTLGNLHLLGRTKDVININGVKFVSSDIQRAIEQAVGSNVSRIVCFSSRASHTEQITVAYWPSAWPMVAENMARIDALVIQACTMCTAAQPLVFALSEASVSRLPLSSLGKISTAKMRTMFEAGVFADDVKSHVRATANLRREKSGVLGASTVHSEDELLLLRDFASVLEVEMETLDVDSTMFELGFTSMHIVKLKHRVDSRLGISIPMIQFLKQPTVRSFANALSATIYTAPGASGGVLSPEYDPVVTLRSAGSKSPLWLVHPGVGEVLVFVGLARQLAGDDRPVYALRARGFEDGQTRFASITEAVEVYVAAIKQRQPRGPYAIAGYSYGTMLAFEVAKVLDAHEGKSVVRFLGSFNLPPHIKNRMRQLSWNMCLLHLAQFLDLVTEGHVEVLEATDYRSLSRDQALVRILCDTDNGRLGELGLNENSLGRWADVAYGLQSMATDYEPRGSVDVLDAFHAMPLKVAAASREEWLREHLGMWKDFCHTAPRYHEVGGAHYTMIGPDHVQGFAAVLISALSSRGL
ncbi:acetyl-CoA synthetase-like protein [Nemania serpens]|nr:acetyl-CoA synthetase-like protein [Nemania serpens]